MTELDIMSSTPDNEIINYKGKTFKMDFELMDIPRLVEVKNFTQGAYYMTNRKDTWFVELLELYYTSNLHGSIINNLHLMINEGTDDELIYRISLDYCIFGGYALEILWNYYHTKIVKINHLDFTKIRAGLVDKETHQIEYFIYSNDWFKPNYRKWKKIEIFNENKTSSDHQIYYYKRYTPSSDIYPKPLYNAALKYIYCQNELSTYFSSLIKNNFVANGILHLPNPQSEIQMRELERTFLRDNTGSRNAGGIIVTTGEKDQTPEFIKFNNDEDDGKYTFLPEYTDQQIARGHGVPVPLLFSTPGKLGGTDEVEFFEKKYRINVVDPIRRDIIKSFEKIKALMI